MTTLEERINDIIYDNEFNELPFEERARICKYLDQMKIQTLYQIAFCSENRITTEAWRDKMRKRLKYAVEEYERQYGRTRNDRET